MIKYLLLLILIKLKIISIIYYKLIKIIKMIHKFIIYNNFEKYISLHNNINYLIIIKFN